VTFGASLRFFPWRTGVTRRRPGGECMHGRSAGIVRQEKAS